MARRAVRVAAAAKKAAGVEKGRGSRASESETAAAAGATSGVRVEACVAAGIHPPTADDAAAEEGVPAQSHDAGQLSEVS